MISFMHQKYARKVQKVFIDPSGKSNQRHRPTKGIITPGYKIIIIIIIIIIIQCPPCALG